MCRCTVWGNGAGNVLYGAETLNAQSHWDKYHCMLLCMIASHRCSWKRDVLHVVNTLRWLKTLLTFLTGLIVPPHFKSPERVTQEPHAPALGSPNRGTFSTQPCSAPSSSLLSRHWGCFQLGLSHGATDTSALAALSLHQQPAAPMKFPRLCCSHLSPSAHSSKPQNGTNPT